MEMLGWTGMDPSVRMLREGRAEDGKTRISPGLKTGKNILGRGDCKRKGFQAGPSREDSRDGKEAHIVGAGRSRSHGSS